MITRIYFCLALYCAMALHACLLHAAEPPNVVFVFSDDQRFNSLSMTGDPVTQTPHLDRLASEGVFFNQAFITTPICGPSRANIFTGQWERKNHIGFSSVTRNFIDEDAFANSWLMQLKNAGYSTAFIGKHHTKIVDRGNTPLKANTDFCYYGEGHLGFYFGKHKAFTNLKNRTQVEGLFEATEAYLRPGQDFDYFFENADKSVASCLKRRDPKKPFAAWINFNLPHAASIGGMGSKPSDPAFYSSLYDDQVDAIPVPDGHPNDIALPKEVFNHDDLMPYYRYPNRKALLNTKVKMNRAVYAIDQFMGNLRKMLVEIGEDQNTIIVFCSDNGLLLGEHGLGGKTMLYEESVHVPLIVYSPSLPEKQRGTQRSAMVVGQDIPATILDMCGLEVPKSYQGASMLPLLEGKQIDWRRDVFLENLFTMQGYPRQEAVRSKRYKYIRYFSKDNDRDQYLPNRSIEGEAPIYEELFDLQNDPNELTNLARSLGHAEVLQTYRDRCQELLFELAQ